QVFSTVTSLLSLAVFKDQWVLEDLVQEMQEQNTALSFGPLEPNGFISVQGSFPAITALRDFLLLKANSLSNEGKREKSRSHQRLKRRAEQRRVPTVHDGERQEVVLDTDVYHYMKHFFPRTLQVNDRVSISSITDGDTTTIRIEGAGSRSDPGQVVRVREKIETQSVKLYSTLRKERICFEERSSRGKEWYERTCHLLKASFPQVLIIPYDSHIDVIGSSSDVFEFTKKV
ncbi:RBM43 protein, partial [Upupa epops]|nr:RBM43 protein [Upupa epops]